MAHEKEALSNLRVCDARGMQQALDDWRLAIDKARQQADYLAGFDATAGAADAWERGADQNAAKADALQQEFETDCGVDLADTQKSDPDYTPEHHPRTQDPGGAPTGQNPKEPDQAADAPLAEEPGVPIYLEGDGSNPDAELFSLSNPPADATPAEPRPLTEDEVFSLEVEGKHGVVGDFGVTAPEETEPERLEITPLPEMKPMTVEEMPADEEFLDEGSPHDCPFPGEGCEPEAPKEPEPPVDFVE